MNSMNYIGKFISNFRDFYNDINTATLTGAIDVVVVEQADGTFNCSPFHVRFGKLGVLRSREKVVDIEINGEPLELQMKLGESGEAFFVEEVPLDELGDDVLIPPHLACSPIPSETFLLRYQDQDPDQDQWRGQPGFKMGAVVDDLEALQRPKWPQVEARKSISCPEVRPTITPIPAHEISLLVSPGADDSDHAPGTVKTFRAETMEGKVSEKVRRISIVTGEFRPISLEPQELQPEQGRDEEACVDGASVERDAVERVDAPPPNTVGTDVKVVGGKKKRRKKSLMKKKAGAKKNGTSSSSQNDQSEAESTSTSASTSTSISTSISMSAKPDVATMKELLEASAQINTVALRADLTVQDTQTQSEENIFEIDDLGDGLESPLPLVIYDHAIAEGKISLSNAEELASLKHATTEKNFHFFSDTEVTPGSSPLDSRPGSPMQSDSEAERQRHAVELAGGKEGAVLAQSWRWGELPTLPTPRTSRQVSSTGLDPNGAGAQDPDAAAEAAQRSIISDMFSFMKKTKRMRHNPEADGIYLADIKTADLDPEVAAIYFPISYRQGANPQGDSSREEDRESGNGTSLPQSPHSVDGSIGGPKSSDSDFGEPNHSNFPDTAYNEISMSLCGGLNENGPDEQAFAQSLVTYEDLVAEPKIIENPDLVVRLDGKYYNWKTACPMVMSVVVYQRALPQHVVDAVTSDYMPHPPKDAAPLPAGAEPSPGRGYSSWFSWRKSTEPKKMMGEGDGPQELGLTADPDAAVADAGAGGDAGGCGDAGGGGNNGGGDNGGNGGGDNGGGGGGDNGGGDAGAGVDNGGGDNGATQRFQDGPECEKERRKGDFEVQKLTDKMMARVPVADIGHGDCGPFVVRPPKEVAIPLSLPVSTVADVKEEEAYNGSNSSDSEASLENRASKLPRNILSLYEHSDLYRKTLRLSSEQIAGLNLVEGANEVVFSVTTAYQGTTRCKCHIYKWRHDDKIVVSDIDGTITKSDVLGHILPIVGKDWAQSGVAQLFTKIQNNGYRLLYLSARAIGQARVTREYLRSIRQGDLSLPDGPLLLNPTSLISAFHREVIEKKPEEFKISCLRDIHALFPVDSEPFYAGYGNKVNDVWAYRAVGIPIFRIFTINHRGELKHELTQTFQSSYSNMSFIVDQMFPPPPTVEPSGDFSSFVYWRDPIADITIELPIKESPKKSSHKVPNNKKNSPRKEP